MMSDKFICIKTAFVYKLCPHLESCFCSTCRNRKLSALLSRRDVSLQMLHRIYFSSLTCTGEELLDVQFEFTKEEIMDPIHNSSSVSEVATTCVYRIIHCKARVVKYTRDQGSMGRGQGFGVAGSGRCCKGNVKKVSFTLRSSLMDGYRIMKKTRGQKGGLLKKGGLAPPHPIFFHPKLF